MGIFVQRLVEERDELLARLELLSRFNAGTVFQQRSETERVLLTRQQNLMAQLLSTLNERIEFYENDSEN